jgi:hypothetical protein
MKVIVVLVLVVSLKSFSQSESTYKIESFQAFYTKEYLHHGNQVFNRFTNTVDYQNIFVQNDSALSSRGNSKWYNYSQYTLETSLRKPDSKWRINLGVSYNRRTERSYRFGTTRDNYFDTTIAYVPQYGGGGIYDTVILDSVSIHNLEYLSLTYNVFIHGEYLRDFKLNKLIFSTGLGIGIGMSLVNRVFSFYQRDWALWMVSPADGEKIWTGDIPYFSPVAYSSNGSGSRRVENGFEIAKGNSIFTLKPYLPIRFEYLLGSKGFFGKVGLLGSFNTGMEFQIVKNDGISSRFFYNFKTGIRYHI